METPVVDIPPPPGMSLSFWKSILLEQKKSYDRSLSTLSMGMDRGKAKASLDRALQEFAQKKWEALNSTQQGDYTKADAQGLRYDPNSTQGINEQQLNEDRARQEAAMGAHTQDVGEQRQNLYKLKAQSDPHITAEEKLMMEMTRREADADYKGKVGATMNEMQARGMSGSGAELTRNLAGASDSANRHAIEALGAQANAQKRAMDSLGKASDLSSTMATQSGADATNANNALNADQDTQFTLANDAEVEKKLK